MSPVNKRAYAAIALLLSCALLIVLYVIISNSGKPNTGAVAQLTPTYAMLPQATGGTGNAGGSWDDWGMGGNDALPTDGAMTTPAPATHTPAPTATPTAEPTATSSALKAGSQGEEVRYVQKRLKELGYLSGSADGDFGAATETALKAFQKANGLTADGVAGTRTMTALQSSKAKSSSSSQEAKTKATDKPKPRTYTPSPPSTYRYLQLGSTGSDVTKLQKRLIELGYLSGSANGTYGDDTEAAVRAFQKRNGQWEDGVAGQDTQSALYSADALPQSKD